MGKHKQGKTRHSDASRAATIREQEEAAQKKARKQAVENLKTIETPFEPEKS